MADGGFNISKGAIAEMFRTTANVGLLLLLIANETENDLVDHADLAAMLAAPGNTEASDASYGRKVGLTGVVTVDNTNNRVDVDLPDQTWSALQGAAIVKVVTGFEFTAVDTGRRPMTHHDFSITPDGSDVTVQFNAAGFVRHT